MADRLNRRQLLAGALLALPGMAGAANVRRLAPALDRLVAPGAAVEVVADGITWAEGPVWLPREGALLFSDPPANLVRRWTPGGGAMPFLSPSGLPDPDPKLVREGGANGLALDAAGRLLIADSGHRALHRLDLRTRRRVELVARYKGRRFNSPNDMSVGADGTIWFTDPPYGLAGLDDSPLREQPHNGVYRWRAGGEAVLVDAALTRPNGIALAPGGRRLYVSNSDEASPQVWAYDLDARGDVRDRRVFADFAGRPGPGNCDGMKVAPDGTVLCTGPGGLHLLTPEGEPIGQVVHDQPIANCALGGGALYMAANHQVLRVAMGES
jgi:gluconolactonase